MEKSEIEDILLAPLCTVRCSTEKEKRVFADKKDGWFYTFGLTSGQVFVGRISEREGVYSFRPLKNLVSDLQEIEWRKKKSVEDLGYTTTCVMQEDVSEKEKELYEEILAPKAEDSSRFPITKVSFKYYTYHPMLEKAYFLQMARWECERAKKALLDSQKHLKNLLISETNPTIQQKFNERRQQNG